MSKKLKNIVRYALTCVFLFTVGTAAAQQTITGTIVDSTGEPVIGATVKEQGTTNAAVTDFDGNFTLSVSGKKPVEISYIGMKTKTVDVAGKSSINVTLEDEANDLNEVVVIGYGTVQKKDLTGAVATLSSEKIADIPVSNVSEAMTGKLAGVNVTTTEGSPDADINIRVRGGGSLSQDNSPLYIVDGFEVASISDISPSEIESIDVLKDASSTAIYGARGANGVIIITTKSGKEGNIQVNFNANYGFKKIAKEVKVMDPYNYAYYQYELAPTSGDYGNFNDLDIWKSVEGDNWQDEVFGRTGHHTHYDVSVSGGSKELNFNLGFNHDDEKSIMLGSGYAKNNINAKLKAQLSKWLTLDFTGRLNFTKLDGLNGGADTNESNAANSIVANTVRWRPVDPLTQNNDDDEDANTSTQRTPYQRITASYKYQERFDQTYNAGLNWKPWKGWTFRTAFSYSWKYNNTDQVWGSDATTNSKFGYNGQPQTQFIRMTQQKWTNQNTITYDNKKLFGGRDRINVLLGQEWSSIRQKTRTNTIVAFPATMTTFDEVLSNTQAGTPLPAEVSIPAKDNLIGFFTRINYTLNEKYLATVTMRADGSSKFADGNRWGFFPSVALAWRMSDENFLKDVRWISNLKMRLSFGTAGNNRIPAGSTYPAYTLASNTSKAPFFDENRTFMLEHKSVLYNPNLKWETTITRNLGIDYGFFRSRLNGSIDFYYNTTKDLLMQSVVPSNTGYTLQYQNFGTTQNTGVELTLNAVIFDKKDFGLNFNFNIAYNHNKIKKLAMDNPWAQNNWAGSTFSKYENYYIEEGGRLGELYGYKMKGYYTVYDPNTGTGDLIWNGRSWEMANGAVDNSCTLFGGQLKPGVAKVQVDENGDPIKQRLGNTIAPTTGGFGLDGRWKGFDFNVFFSYAIGNKIVNGTKLANSFYAGSSKGYNLVADFDIANRYTWIDPANGLNLGSPSTSTIANYCTPEEIAAGDYSGLYNRINAINANAKIYNPCGMSNMQLTDYAVESASFLRLQTLTVGYTLPKNWVKKIYLQNVRIYFTGQNLFCITGYDGYDPEVDTSSKKNPMTPGVDYAAYPKSRTYVAGINVTF